MKVLVAGANGQVGKHLVKLLQESKEHSVRAMVRKEEQAASLNEAGVEAVLGNLEGSVEDLAKAAEGCDAIVFSAGSGGNTDSDKTLLVDLDGAVKTMEAAKKAGIERFVMVSAIQANNRENWYEPLKPYYVAKHYADKILEGSGLNYTIVRPGGLTNDPGTGKVAVAENLKGGFIPREDVAKTIIAALSDKKAFRQAFDLTSGKVAIRDAISKIGSKEN